jgi:PAS domain S-box-containing protein
MKDSEPNFRTFTEQSPNMIFINRSGTVVYANRKCEEVMGYTREEFLSPDFDYLTLIAPESVDLVRANFQRHLNGEEVEPYEYTLISKSNKKIDAIITSKLIYYNGKPALLDIVTDITQRKQAENALQKSEEKFRQAFAHAPIGMMLCQMDGTIIQVNPALYRMLGYSESELKQLTFRDFTHPEDLEKQIPFYEKCVSGEISSYQLEKRYIKKDGEIIWVSMTAAITADQAGHRAKDLVKRILAFSRKSEQDKKIILITPIIKEVVKLLRASLPTGNEHILFVDDEETLIDLGKNMLARLGYRVTARTNPLEAIGAFKADPDKFDLVISDMTMPAMTGDVLADEIIKLRPDIPIIICTGFSEHLSEKKIKTLALKGLLMKPLTISELAKTVRKVLDAKQG